MYDLEVVLPWGHYFQTGRLVYDTCDILIIKKKRVLKTMMFNIRVKYIVIE